MLRKLMLTAKISKFLPKKGHPSIEPILTALKHYFQNKGVSVLEIGARYGDSSVSIIKSLNVKKYTIIDPYECYTDYNDGINLILKENDTNKIFDKTVRRINSIFKNVTFYRKFSNDQDLLKALTNEKYDLVFIDGNHSYDYVLKDLQNFYTRLNIGGVLCGDDYFMRHINNDDIGSLEGLYPNPMVYEAVEEFSKIVNKQIHTFGSHRYYPKIFAFIK